MFQRFLWGEEMLTVNTYVNIYKDFADAVRSSHYETIRFAKTFPNKLQTMPEVSREHA